jgi:hypothetical protein
LLEALGVVSGMLGALSISLLFPGLVALPLALTTWAMVVRDLRQIRAGLMDPAGETKARIARKNAIGGALCAVLGVAGAGLILLTLLSESQAAGVLSPLTEKDVTFSLKTSRGNPSSLPAGRPAEWENPYATVLS